MKFIDASQLPDGHVIEADLCIIGAGAAGLALAAQFRNRAARVALLESGGLAAETAVQDLCDGTIVGVQDFPLRSTRLRLFGGSTNHWAGWVRPLSALDFKERPWVTDSGWPFSRADLQPFYARASRFLRLPKQAFRVAAWEADGLRAWRFHGGHVRSGVIQIPGPAGRLLGDTLRQH